MLFVTCMCVCVGVCYPLPHIHIQSKREGSECNSVIYVYIRDQVLSECVVLPSPTPCHHIMYGSKFSFNTRNPFECAAYSRYIGFWAVIFRCFWSHTNRYSPYSFCIQKYVDIPFCSVCTFSVTRSFLAHRTRYTVCIF